MYVAYKAKCFSEYLYFWLDDGGTVSLFVMNTVDLCHMLASHFKLLKLELSAGSNETST